MIKRALVLPVALLTVLVTAFDAGAGGTPPGASHTDSLLSNAASTAGASALPGDPIQVACWSTVDWKKFAASHHFRSSIDGYINYDEMSIDLTTGPKNPRGCFLVQAALVCGDEADCVRREVAKRRGRLEALLLRRFENAVSEGDLSSNADPADLARYVVTVVHGIAVQAPGGATRRELSRVAEVALQAWPA